MLYGVFETTPRAPWLVTTIAGARPPPVDGEAQQPLVSVLSVGCSFESTSDSSATMKIALRSRQAGEAMISLTVWRTKPSAERFSQRSFRSLSSPNGHGEPSPLAILKLTAPCMLWQLFGKIRASPGRGFASRRSPASAV